jgi:hypothetical protein
MKKNLLFRNGLTHVQQQEIFSLRGKQTDEAPYTDQVRA